MVRIVLFLLLLCAPPPAAFAQSPSGAPAAPRNNHLLVVLIGGMDSDPTSEQLRDQARRGQGNSGLYQLRGDLAQPRVLTEYFNWNGTRGGDIRAKRPGQAPAICEVVRDHLQNHPGDKVAIVGNSWGGHTALDVATRLYQCEAPLHLNLLVLLDPSSTGRAVKNPRQLPRNISDGVNYFTRNAFVWGQFKEPRMTNVDLADPALGFLSKGGPAYDSTFSFPAHVAAEWDDRIHADIKRRLLELLND